MSHDWKEVVWRQFGAAIDMLGNTIRHCPDDLWSDRSKQPEYWYLVYHTLFWLDLYLSGPVEGFAPPAPFGLEELDPAGILPERPYSKKELQTYLEHGRKKCRAAIEELTEARGGERYRFGWGEASYSELLLYNMRHVQHHAAQLNLILRQQIDSTPGWVAQAKSK
jgi:DinB family protein